MSGAACVHSFGEGDETFNPFKYLGPAAVAEEGRANRLRTRGLIELEQGASERTRVARPRRGRLVCLHLMPAAHPVAKVPEEWVEEHERGQRVEKGQVPVIARLDVGQLVFEDGLSLLRGQNPLEPLGHHDDVLGMQAEPAAEAQ